MDIALMRGMVKKEILSHDLLDNSILYDFFSTTTKTNNSQIIFNKSLWDWERSIIDDSNNWIKKGFNFIYS